MSIGRLQAQLKKIETAATTGQWMEQACQFVVGAAKMLCPGYTGELRNSITYEVEKGGFLFWKRYTGIVYTDKAYAPYVELGTGPKGADDHAGISPEITPSYTLEPWWIHESMIDPGLAEMYHWPAIKTPDGVFYRCSGQAAQPFLYPALADNEATVVAIITKGINAAMEAGGE